MRDRSLHLDASILQLISLLVLGAIVNVAVAWGFAICGDYQFNGVSSPVASFEFYATIDEPFSSDARLRYGGMAAGRLRMTGRDRVGLSELLVRTGKPRLNTCAPEDLIPHWACAMLHFKEYDAQGSLKDTGDEWYYYYSVVEATGWPLLALRGGLRTPAPGRYFYDSTGVRVELSEVRCWIIPVHLPAQRARLDEYKWLPLCPLWPGFAVNTVFYATILWLMLAAPFALRRRLRARRGQCQQCGYPIGVSPVCTECGAALPASAATRLASRHE